MSRRRSPSLAAPLPAARALSAVAFATALAACGDDASGGGGSGASGGAGVDHASSGEPATTAAASSAAGTPVDEPPYDLPALDAVRIHSHDDQESFPCGGPQSVRASRA